MIRFTPMIRCCGVCGSSARSSRNRTAAAAPRRRRLRIARRYISPRPEDGDASSGRQDVAKSASHQVVHCDPLSDQPLECVVRVRPLRTTSDPDGEACPQLLVAVAHVSQRVMP